MCINFTSLTGSGDVTLTQVNTEPSLPPWSSTRDFYWQIEIDGGITDFVADIDFAHMNFKPSEIHAENTDGYFMIADSTGFGWMKKYNHTSVSGTPINMAGTKLYNGTYLLEWFNTWTGETIEADTAICVEGITWGEVTDDIDGETRPKGSAYDIGFDEY